MMFKGKEEGSSLGTPHPDYETNLRYFKSFVERAEVAQKLRDWGVVTYYEGIGNIRASTYSILSLGGFAWKERKSKFACPISFHQTHQDFIRELNKFFGIKELTWNRNGMSTYGSFK